jgi:predicted amidophosphoribosyltransferase
VDFLLYKCTNCGRRLQLDRRLCGICYKKGFSIRSKFCPDCGKETESRKQTYCHECRDLRKREETHSHVFKRRMSGIERYRMMKVAATAMKCDKYAQKAAVITDDEIALKREKFLALLAADVHCGTYGRPSRHTFAAQREEEPGGFGTLAYQHMRGGEAGHGTDRDHTVKAQQNRESRRLHD